MRGDSVFKEIRRDRPSIQALFMSGYNDGTIDRSVEILEKPFEFPELGRRLRTILDRHSKEGRSSAA